MKRRLILVVFVIFIVGIFYLDCNKVYAEVTKLDSSFSEDGYVIHNNAAGGNGTDGIKKIIIDSNNKIVAIGSSASTVGNLVTVWRYDKNGDLDPSFNSVGYSTYSVPGGGYYDQGLLIRELDDGKYLLMGYTDNNLSRDLTVWRIHQNGIVDTSFNGIGYFQSHLSDNLYYSSFARGMDLDRNGKIVLVGFTKMSPGLEHMTIWRLYPDGNLDTTLNGAGYKMFPIVGNEIEEAYDIEIATDNTYVISGRKSVDYNLRMKVWKILEDGSFDTSFNGTGQYVYDNQQAGSPNDNGCLVEITKDYIYVGGRIKNVSDKIDIAVLKMDMQGNLVTDFDSDGLYQLAIKNDSSVNDIQDMFISEEGKIYFSGYSYDQYLPESTIYAYWCDTPITGELTNKSSDYCLTFDNINYIRSIDSFNSIIVDGRKVYVGGRTGPSENIDAAFFAYESLYQIRVSDDNLQTIVEGKDIKSTTTNGSWNSREVFIKDRDIYVGWVHVELGNDLDWTQLLTGVNTGEYKSFIHNLINCDGTVDNYSLYIPARENDNRIGICLGANSLSLVNDDCDGLYYLDLTSENVSQEFLDGRLYWRMDGLTGTGGFSDSISLSQTGADIQLLWLILLSYSLVYRKLVLRFSQF